VRIDSVILQKSAESVIFSALLISAIVMSLEGAYKCDNKCGGL